MRRTGRIKYPHNQVSSGDVRRAQGRVVLRAPTTGEDGPEELEDLDAVLDAVLHSSRADEELDVLDVRLKVLVEALLKVAEVVGDLEGARDVGLVNSHHVEDTVALRIQVGEDVEELTEETVSVSPVRSDVVGDGDVEVEEGHVVGPLHVHSLRLHLEQTVQEPGTDLVVDVHEEVGRLSAEKIPDARKVSRREQGDKLILRYRREKSHGKGCHGC